jgi:ribosomal-protein-alanine N-acetyltransferase
MHSNSFLTIQEKAGLKKWSAQTWEDFLAQDNTQIFEESGGYLLIQKAHPEMDLVEIAVNPEMQGKGIGTKLLRKLIDYAKKNNFSTIFLEVSEHNLKAQHLYKKMNFVQIATRSNYYRDGFDILADAIIMAWYNNSLDILSEN